MTEKRRAEAVRNALAKVPGSIRALAAEAGVSEGLLRAIRDGTRAATPATIQALAEAAERWEARNAEAARTLRNSLDLSEEEPG